MSMQLTIFEYIKTEKQCCRCKEVKPFINFTKCKSTKDGFQNSCRQCLNLYYKNNKIIILRRSKINYIKNKEMHKQKSRDYYQNNKERIAQYFSAYQRNRRKSDTLFRLIHNLRRRLGSFCKSVGMQKNWSTIDAMGCNREEFIAYFEPLFTEGMTWENYGAWHVDHIKPISLATTEQEAIQLSHYTNLQPLWAADNLSKGNKYD